jgi:cytoskeletal protein RodZ
MEPVGNQLRRARLELGLSLEQVSDRTRILLKNLKAIEDDDLSKIGSPFFYKSFVRQFAQEVKLKYDDLRPAVDAAAQTMPQPQLPGEIELPPPKLAPARARRTWTWRGFIPFASLICILVGCSAIYGLWRDPNSVLHTPVSAWSPVSAHVSQQSIARSAKPHTQIPVPHPVPSATVAPSTADEEDAGDTQVADQTLDPKPDVAAPEENHSLQIEISAFERTWLSIVTDGQTTFSGILEAAETKVLQGREKAKLRTGNAGGINVVFNGKNIGPLGSRGQVRTVVFTKDNYEVLQSAAAADIASALTPSPVNVSDAF